jgi:rod shape-determining protein MreC
VAAPANNRIPFSAEATAEFLVLVILIWFAAGPVSGTLLNTQAFISGVFTHGAMQVKSTKDLATQVLRSSERIKTLEAKLAKAELELAQQKQQSKDTNKLRALLGLRDKAPRRTIAAEVVERQQDNWFKQVVIDRGSDEGVKKGSAVITHDGVVGQVLSVSSHAAVVRLLTDPEQKLGVVIQRLKLTGILSGNGAQSAKIDYVPVGTNVDVGDKVVTLAKGGVFPDDHPVGQVVAVRRDSNGASLQIEVKLSENCYDLNEVLVLTPAG